MLLIPWVGVGVWSEVEMEMDWNKGWYEVEMGSGVGV